MTIAMAPLALVDLGFTVTFLGRLDLGVTASCCSLQLDGPVAAAGFASGPRTLATALAVLFVVSGVGVCLYAARSPRPALVGLAGALSFASLPLAVAAIVLEVAPHAFELPGHLCPFCLLKGDVLFLGYPLFGAVFFAVAWAGGAGLAGVFARRRGDLRAPFERFAAGSLKCSAFSWIVALCLGVAPVVRYAIVSGGASLFR
jgi:hypothetical protein